MKWLTGIWTPKSEQVALASQLCSPVIHSSTCWIGKQLRPSPSNPSLHVQTKSFTMVFPTQTMIIFVYFFKTRLKNVLAWGIRMTRIGGTLIPIIKWNSVWPTKDFRMHWTIFPVSHRRASTFIIYRGRILKVSGRDAVDSNEPSVSKFKDHFSGTRFTDVVIKTEKQSTFCTFFTIDNKNRTALVRKSQSICRFTARHCTVLVLISPAVHISIADTVLVNRSYYSKLVFVNATFKRVWWRRVLTGIHWPLHTCTGPDNSVLELVLVRGSLFPCSSTCLFEVNLSWSWIYQIQNGSHHEMSLRVRLHLNHIRNNSALQTLFHMENQLESNLHFLSKWIGLDHPYLQDSH